MFRNSDQSGSFQDTVFDIDVFDCDTNMSLNMHPGAKTTSDDVLFLLQMWIFFLS